MSVINQAVSTLPVKPEEEAEPVKWSFRVYNQDVPYWLALLVVIVVVVAVCWYTGFCCNKKKFALQFKKHVT